jgi:YbbR domain-containing protein
MITRLGQNLGVKLLSLACSFALFLYVHKQRVTERTLQVPLSILHDPRTRVVDQVGPRQKVRVTFTGPADQLKLVEGQTRAVVDLRGQDSGLYREHVVVRYPPVVEDQVEVHWSPQVVTVRLEGKAARELPVQPVFSVQPPAGLKLGTVTVEPQTVSVTGWARDVNRVRRVQAVVNSLGTGSLMEVEVRVPARAVDGQEVEITEDIHVQPSTVKVRAPLQRTVWFKSVYVSPNLGETPPSVRLQRISVTPRRLTLQGPEAAVGSVQLLETEPIAIPDSPGVVDREFAVILPPSVTTVERPRVRVVIAVESRE